MALTIAFEQSCGMCFGGKGLRNAIVWEACRRDRNVFGRNMRFNNFFVCKVSKICFRSKHTLAKKLLKEVHKFATASVSNRSKLLNKVSVLNSLGDLIQNEIYDKQRGIKNDFDLSSARQRFPSINVGSSPPVVLYEETKTACVSESKDQLVSQRQSFESSTKNWVANPDDSSLSLALNPEVKSDEAAVDGSSTKLGCESQLTAASTEFFLDKSVSCITGLSKRHANQLENSGFHTLRKLLHHFPRTYADLQNGQIDMNDGEYFIFVGRILSSSNAEECGT